MPMSRPTKNWSKATLAAFKMISSQDFEDFMKKDFQDFIEGDENAKSADEICAEIASMMGEPTKVAEQFEVFAESIRRLAGI
jgi:hypothetical protein